MELPITMECQMAKKMKSAEKSAQKQDAGELGDAVRHSAQLIWQAGLGAFSRVQREGSHLFDNLGKAGIDVEKQMRNGNADTDFTHMVADMAGAVGQQAMAPLDNLERMFEQRIGRALARIGVASGDDIRQLMSEVERLQVLVAALQRRSLAAQVAAAPAPVAAPAKKAQPRARPVAAVKPVPGTRSGKGTKRGSPA
ncbi:MAG: poly(hydroxyalkanoate) granule-associated protein [Janthinobacterium sp.]|jgi:poly(hydroxyalkanoate) granule-associated protein